MASSIKNSILIISNDTEFLTGVAGMFYEKYELIIVNDTDEALRKLELDRYAKKIYLIMLDLDLPDGQSFNLLDDIRIDDVFSEIPIVTITSSVFVENELQALRSGAVACLFKPINLDLLFQRAENYIKISEKLRYTVSKILKRQNDYVTAELEMRANTDMLTMINNKFSFFEKTEDMLKTNLDKNYTIYRFNIERFRVVNDVLGAEVGDQILRDIGSFFKENLPTEDCVYGRLERDHFAICALDGSLDIETFLTALSKAIEVRSCNLNIQIKVGVYKVKDKFLPIIKMCDRANLALQSIKGNYLKRIEHYDNSLRDVLLSEQELVNDMEQALHNKEFVIYLQPIVSLLDEKVVSAEALVRWIHPKRGLIAPGGFIPFFERSGLIAKLDSYVWDLVFAYQRKRIDAGLPEISISTNISRMSLYNAKLHEDIIALSKKYDVPPRLVKLEVTESAYNDNSAQLLTIMKNLQDYGFLILMDDFGSGYSSLNMLKNVPVDILKIDMCFLQDFEKSEKAANILTSVVRMAKWLKMPVICEGVETQDQLDFLKSIGSDFVQGYFYSKPVCIEEFEKFEVKKHRNDMHLTSLVSNVNELNAIFNSNALVSRLLNTFIGAIGFYEYTDDRLEIMRVNDNYYSMMGYTPESFHQNKMNIFEMVVPEYRQSLLDACKSAIEGNNPHEILIQRYLPDGNAIWLGVLARYIGGGNGISVICLCLNNVTEQKAIENRNREQTLSFAKYMEFFRSVLDTLPCCVCEYTMDDEHKVLFANKRCYEFYGQEHPTDFLSENTFSECDVFNIENKDEFFNFLEEVKKNRKSMLYRSQIIQTSGKIVPIMGMVSIIKSYRGGDVFLDTFYYADSKFHEAVDYTVNT